MITVPSARVRAGANAMTLPLLALFWRPSGFSFGSRCMTRRVPRCLTPIRMLNGSALGI